MVNLKRSGKMVVSSPAGDIHVKIVSSFSTFVQNNWHSNKECSFLHLQVRLHTFLSEQLVVTLKWTSINFHWCISNAPSMHFQCRNRGITFGQVDLLVWCVPLIYLTHNIDYTTITVGWLYFYKAATTKIFYQYTILILCIKLCQKSLPILWNCHLLWIRSGR